MGSSLTFRQYFPVALLLVISFACRLVLSSYGLPYLVHVDESLILKDPLKILLTYKSGDFHLPTNLYNYVLTIWHVVVFCTGLIMGKWHSMVEYQNAVAGDSYQIIFAFRFLNILLSMAADIIFLRFIFKKLNVSYSVKFLFSLLIIFNPIVYNSVGFVKFDAICYLFYAILIYLGYIYFVEKRVEYRRKLYIISFLAVATRIEEVSFLAGFLLYDFFVIYKHNVKSFFNRKLMKDLLPGFLLYCLITLIPVALIYNWLFAPKVILTQTETFEQVIYEFVSWSALKDYTFYIINSLMLLSPVVIFIFLFKLFKNNASIRFLIIPIVITNVVLALDLKKNVFYFLLSSVIIIFVFIKYLEESRNKRLSMALLLFTLLYFLSYDSELLYYMLNHNSNQSARQIVLNNSTPNDTIICDGISDMRIPLAPQILREQIAALKEVGGSTGYGLAEKLKASIKDSADSRRYFSRVEDYFWVKTKYEGKWLIGYDTATIKRINPKLIVIFSFYNTLAESYLHTVQTYGNVLAHNYTLLSEQAYHFPDPRLYYRNFYFFHSYFIYIRKPDITHNL